MIVLPEQFEAQLDWLARQHYQVIRLAELAEFLAGRRPLSQRSVVITFDDGYESVYRYALPVLRKHGFPATVFMVSDFIGARDALSWSQLEALARSGLVDIQAHSKTHRNLAQPRSGEADSAYLQDLELELRQPRTVLERRLGAAGVRVRSFAYPYGNANEAVVQAMQREQYTLGLTVSPGGNSFFAHPLLLHRSMIFGDASLDEFKARLQTQRSTEP
jgi:peptidoglycan/xylan/chitin deacetylase (PgdA/CDA1 family)